MLLLSVLLVVLVAGLWAAPAFAAVTVTPIATTITGNLRPIAVAPDGTTYVVAYADNTIYKISGGTQTSIGGTGMSPWAPITLALSPDGHTLYWGDGDPTDANGTIYTMNTSTLVSGSISTTLTDIDALAVASDGTVYAVAYGDSYVHKIVGGVMSNLNNIAANYQPSLALSPDGHTLYMGDSDSNIWPIDTGTGSRGTALSTGLPAYSVNALALSAAGHTLYVGTSVGGTILAANTAGWSWGTPIATGISVGSNGINSLGVASDGTIYADTDGSAYLYSIVDSHTISFNSNGGSAVTAITQGYDTAVTTPTAPVKTGYTFGGWYSDSGLTSPYTFTTMPDADTTLYAAWTPNTYTISFVSNGGTAVSSIVQTYGSSVATPTAPTRTGYTFAGWYSDSGLTSPYTFTTMPLNTTLYAKWTINEYTITFDSNGGSAVTAITQDFGSAVSAPAAPTKAGFVFAGWFSDAALDNTYAFSTMPASNTTLYAAWNTAGLTVVPITTDTRGSAYSQIEALAVAQDGTVYAANANGYIYKIVSGAVVGQIAAGGAGWGDRLAISPDGGTLYLGTFNDGDVYPINTGAWTVGTPIVTDARSSQYSQIAALAVAPDGTLYASNVNGYTYKIVSGAVVGQIAAGGAGWGDSLAISPDGSTLYLGTENSGDVYPISTGSWTVGTPIATDMTSGQYVMDLAVAPDGTLYVNADAYVYKIVSGTVVGTTATGQSPFGDSLAVSEGGHTLYVGTHNGGQVLSLDTAPWTWGAPIVTVAPSFNAVAVAPNGTLYAGGIDGTVYAIADSHTISFDSNGGSAVTAITQGYDTTVTAPATPIRTGYTFGGWYSDAGLTLPYTFSTMSDSDVTLYAKWIVNTYTISFVSNGGSAVTAITQDYNTAVTAPAAPTRTGYTFAGWYSDVDLTSPFTFTTMPASDTTLYAKWMIDTYTLAYTAGAHGSIVGSSTQVVDYSADGTTVTATPDPGYHFVGWSDSAPTAARVDLNVTGDVTVNATFAINTFTLRYTAGAHGSLVGSATQVVDYGSNGTTVTATPAAGYHFVSWSDGVLTAARTDRNVVADHNVTANFAFTLLPTKLTVNAFYSSRPHGRFDYFYGAISPNMTLGTPIGFYVKKPGSSTWVRVSTRFTSNSHNWSYSYRLVSRGTYYFQVRFAATSKYQAITSRTISVRSR